MSTHKDEDIDSQETLETMHSNQYISNCLHALTIILLVILILIGLNIQGKLDIQTYKLDNPQHRPMQRPGVPYGQWP